MATLQLGSQQRGQLLHHEASSIACPERAGMAARLSSHTRLPEAAAAAWSAGATGEAGECACLTSHR